MIKEKTVFIFGAGLSSDYHFPTDHQLRDKIIQDLELIEMSDHSKMATKRIELLERMSFSQEELIKFKEGLQRGCFDTIDQFLETRKDPRTIAIGKAAIAMALLSYESKAAFDTGFSNTCFYRFLFQKMVEGTSKETFKDNEVTIVTYNYDRSFEFFLWNTLRNHYEGIKEGEVDNIMKEIKIIHIHGMVGQMHWQDPNFVNYGNEVNYENLILAKNGIVIFNEIDGAHNKYKEAHRAILEAENVVFVGFGFDLLNLSRLIEGGCLEGRSNILATAVGINDGKINKIARLTGGKLSSGNMIRKEAVPFANEYLTWLQ